MKGIVEMENMYAKIRSIFSPDVATQLIKKVENKDINYWDSLIFEEFEIECPQWISDFSYDKFRKGADESFYNIAWEDATKVIHEIEPISRYIKSTFSKSQINKLIEKIQED